MNKVLSKKVELSKSDKFKISIIVGFIVCLIGLRLGSILPILDRNMKPLKYTMPSQTNLTQKKYGKII